ncbi:MAG TPA: T9SS type A sorting domain-containing protein [Ignavibacteria bacterium]|nr:T9SS type A sorting domain-containing protein [Ignavibacteria bacterium]
MNSSATVVLDVNVRIDNISHTWVSDLSIYLRNNLNTGIRLFNKTGGSGDNFVGTIFDDSGAAIIDSAAAPFTGRFRPNQSLNVFNGSYNPSGRWMLTITDTATGDTGFLTKWCLVIQYIAISGVVQTVEIPNTFRLYQNYPNPFNPVTKIRYGLPKNGYVKLTVYDELGKEISVLQDGYQQANTYEAVFDATNLPSGVYYYKLEVDGFNETKKMVIVK